MSFAKVFRAVSLGVALAAAGFLAGCTLTPVYRDVDMPSQSLALRYAEPQTRLEQVVYRTLSGRLGPSDAAAPQFSAQVSATATRIGLSEISGPITENQLTLTITYRVVENGVSVTSGTRSATAGYRTTGQIVADDAARAAAEEQAARAAAETVRLALLADLRAQ
ncbi:LPS assembly lipoprotein LptE [Pelagibacterium sp.]|uniref:LPS assembly lipoprotein LptE n=1 Tax=Pelagibacterium sp. TaxID=1967288 RepID=UPI003BA90B17